MGKVGDRLEEMTAGTDKEEAQQLGLAALKAKSYLECRQIRKAIVVVPECLVNIVCGKIQRTLTPLNAEVAVSLRGVRTNKVHYSLD